jgi:hypothetical protein
VEFTTNEVSKEARKPFVTSNTLQFIVSVTKIVGSTGFGSRGCSYDTDVPQSGPTFRVQLLSHVTREYCIITG